MKVLIVYAHPNPQAFNAALLQTGLDSLDRLGHSYQLSELYPMRFDPLLSPAELAGDQPADVALEQDKLGEADVLILQFPYWWYGMPAILKGWVDRVFSFGFAYDDSHEYETGLLAGKYGMVVTTVGQTLDYYLQDERRDINRVLETIHYGIFHFAGMTALPPYIAYGPGVVGVAGRQAMLADYQTHLSKTLLPLSK